MLLRVNRDMNIITYLLFQVAKEFLQRKLAKTHPFDGPEPALQFPNAHPIKNVPSWLKTEMKKARMGWGRVNDV